MFRTITIVSLMTSFLIVGCGSSSDHHSAPSSSSSSDSSSSSVSNLGNPMNTWGYYGDDVMLGNETIVGEWVIDYSNGNQQSYWLETDGGGTFAADGDFSYSMVIFAYGVNENGTQLAVSLGNNKAHNYACVKFENSCCYINDDEALCKTAP